MASRCGAAMAASLRRPRSGRCTIPPKVQCRPGSANNAVTEPRQAIMVHDELRSHKGIPKQRRPRLRIRRLRRPRRGPTTSTTSGWAPSPPAAGIVLSSPRPQEEARGTPAARGPPRCGTACMRWPNDARGTGRAARAGTAMSNAIGMICCARVRPVLGHASHRERAALPERAREESNWEPSGSSPRGMLDQAAPSYGAL